MHEQIDLSLLNFVGQHSYDSIIRYNHPSFIPMLALIPMQNKHKQPKNIPLADHIYPAKSLTMAGPKNAGIAPEGIRMVINHYMGRDPYQNVGNRKWLMMNQPLVAG